MSRKIILVTSGEPGGIGPDICLDLTNINVSSDYIIVVIGDVQLLEDRAKILNKNINIVGFDNVEDICNYSSLEYNKSQLLVLNCNCPCKDTLGKLKVENVNYVLNTLDVAIKLCKSGISNTIVTAPLSKEIINMSGAKFMGHTEYFAIAFNCNKVVMMLANNVMKVALLTTHLPLKNIPNYITTDNLSRTIKIIIHSFSNLYGIKNPKIAVCGLNPHAGEGGYLGSEEIEVINPVIKIFQDDGYNVSGSYPADTIFNRASEFDVILAMYHDQGLPVLKYSGFADGVNVTLGLPIIRTSVDHGTALELAGSGKADSASLINAVNFAITFSQLKLSAIL
ncbi:MAG: 4-hydroxythreonine-4-phosphate dehydrogenase PdxA [Neisseriaceae bacterium]